MGVGHRDKGGATLTTIQHAAIQDPRDHVGLVWLNAERMGRVFETDAAEFAGESYLSMVEAVRTWDHSKGFRFSTHAMPALKFRTYRAVMYERGKRMRDKIVSGGRERCWVDPLGSKKLYANIPASSDPEPDTDSKRKLEEVLEIAAEISPWHGAETVRMMANGVDDEQIGAAIGQSPRYARWLRAEIKSRLSGVKIKTERQVILSTNQSPDYDAAALIVCALFKVRQTELADKYRCPRVVAARMFLAHIMHARGMSYPEIALKMKGTRQHSTVITAAHRLRRHLRQGKTFKVWNGSEFVKMVGAEILDLLKKIEPPVKAPATPKQL